MKTLLLSFLIFMFHLACTAQWVELNVPKNNATHFSDIYAITPEIVVVAGNNGTILKTTDGGTTWQQKNSGTTNGLGKIQFPTSNTGYILAGNGKVLKTTDGGEIWASFDLGSNNILLSMSCVDENLIFISGINADSQSILLKSEKGGSSWQTIVTNNPQFRLKNIQFFNNNTGFAASESFPTYNYEILKTQDGGRNWISLDNTITPFNYINQNIGFYYIGGLYKTINSGNTFSNETQAEGDFIDFHAVDEYNIWGIITGRLDGDGSTRGIKKISSNNSGLYTETTVLDNNPYMNMTKIHFANETTGYIVGYKNEKATIWKNSTGINTLGVTDAELTSYKIYPNPTSERINISLNQEFSKDYTVSLIDLSGKIVYQQNHRNKKNITIDVQKFIKGIYILRIKNEKQMYSQKIIIQ